MNLRTLLSVLLLVVVAVVMAIPAMGQPTEREAEDSLLCQAVAAERKYLTARASFENAKGTLDLRAAADYLWEQAESRYDILFSAQAIWEARQPAGWIGGGDQKGWIGTGECPR